MYKTLVVILFTSLSSVPAFAKPHDIYPVSCDVLWAAAKDVLENPKDYSVVAMDEAREKALFVVVGELTAYTDTVALSERGDGCAMNLKIVQVGSDNSDERGFRRRLSKALAKVQSAKPAQPTAAPGQM